MGDCDAAMQPGICTALQDLAARVSVRPVLIHLLAVLRRLSLGLSAPLSLTLPCSSPSLLPQSLTRAFAPANEVQWTTFG